MPPFMTIITRHHPKRPVLFEKCKASVAAQKDEDYEHLILYDYVGAGVAEANKMFFEYKELVTGKYVFMLDDDDVLTTDDFVGDIKQVAKTQKDPGIIFIRMLINQSLVPTTGVVWGKRKLVKCHIGTSCFVMLNKLWKDNIHEFLSIPTTGDFNFINSVFLKRPKVYWHDKLYSKTMQVSKGKAE